MNNLVALARELFGSSGTGRRPWLLNVRSSTWFITATVCTAIFTDIFLYAVIVPVFPFSLVQRVGISPDDVQHWISVLLSVYGAALIVLAPISGWVSDRLNSRRGIMLGGMVALGGSTVMLCVARNLPLLLAGRILQGAAAGVVWVVGLALLADTVGKEKAGISMGYVATAYSISALLAPLLGGIVYDKSGYYAVFAMAFGMIILDLILRLLLIEKKYAERWISDPTQSASETHQTSDSTVVGVALDHVRTPDAKGLDTVALPAASDTLENPAPQIGRNLPPMLILIKSRRMQATFCACTIDSMILTGYDVTLPLFVEEIFHWNSLGAGLIFIPLLLASFLQPLYGWGVDRYGSRWIATFGFAICVVPFVCLRFVTHDSMGQKILLCAMLFLIGLGIALNIAAVMTECVLICAEKERKQPGCMGKSGAYAQSYGLFNVSWALGSLVGSYWAGGIKQAAGFGTVGLANAVLCAVFVVPTVCYIGGSIFAKKARQPEYNATEEA